MRIGTNLSERERDFSFISRLGIPIGGLRRPLQHLAELRDTHWWRHLSCRSCIRLVTGGGCIGGDRQPCLFSLQMCSRESPSLTDAPEHRHITLDCTGRPSGPDLRFFSEVTCSNGPPSSVLDWHATPKRNKRSQSLPLALPRHPTRPSTADPWDTVTRLSLYCSRRRIGVMWGVISILYALQSSCSNIPPSLGTICRTGPMTTQLHIPALYLAIGQVKFFAKSMLLQWRFGTNI